MLTFNNELATVRD